VGRHPDAGLFFLRTFSFLRSFLLFSYPEQEAPMKKLGILTFIFALIAGIVLSNLFAWGNTGWRFFNISFERTTKGSGNITAETRSLEAFKGVQAGGVFHVTVVPGAVHSVEIRTDDNLIELVSTEVRGDTLYIKATRKISSAGAINVTVTSPQIESIGSSGVAKFDVTVPTGASLSIDSSGASRVAVKGEVKELTVDISGAANIDASALKAVNAVVDASGASRAQVFASGRLKAEASGASKITYGGGPSSVERRSSGAGSIESN
jgi:hypothetical protein